MVPSRKVWCGGGQGFLRMSSGDGDQRGCLQQAHRSLSLALTITCAATLLLASLWIYLMGQTTISSHEDDLLT
jgi:hypothetical protein